MTSLCKQNFCIATKDGQRACPTSHSTQWCWVLLATVVPAVPLLILWLNETAWQQPPRRSVTISDQRFWKRGEVPVENVSTVMLFVYVGVIPSLFILISIFGAWKKDIQLRSLSKKKDKMNDLPFRGWALGAWVSINLMNLLVTHVLKSFNNQMRPKSLAECYHVLELNGNNVTNFQGTLNELKICCSLEPKMFRGYPSGHSSTAFAGLLGAGIVFAYNDWMLEGFAHLMCCCCCSSAVAVDDSLIEERNGSSDNDCVKRIGAMGMYAIKTMIVVTCTLLASLIACSRILDGSHFPYQVNGGTIIGIVAVFFLSKANTLLNSNVPLGGYVKSGQGGWEYYKESKSGGLSGVELGMTKSSVGTTNRKRMTVA